MPKVSHGERRKSRVSRLFGSIVLAAGLALPGAAMAQCLPVPTPAFGAVTCAGVDPNVLTVNSAQTKVTVDPGASVAAIDINIPGAAGQFSGANNQSTLIINGQVSGGLTIESGTVDPANYFAPTNSTTLTVDAGASLAGPTALSLVADPGGVFVGSTVLALTNAGSIQSSAGAAIVTNNAARTQINSLVNQAGGTIGAIAVPLYDLNNSGKVDGAGVPRQHLWHKIGVVI